MDDVNAALELTCFEIFLNLIRSTDFITKGKDLGNPGCGLTAPDLESL